jgi:hypothetical protein
LCVAVAVWVCLHLSLDSSLGELDPNFLYYQLRSLSQHPLPPKKLYSLVESRAKQIAAATELLDKTLNTEIYKFAILYVAPGQKSEEEILGNAYGSEAYYRFLARIGMDGANEKLIFKMCILLSRRSIFALFCLVIGLFPRIRFV